MATTRGSDRCLRGRGRGGVVIGSGLLPGGRDENVAASPTAGEFGTGAAGFRKLLPADAGKIREVSLLRLIEGVPNAPAPKKIGPYDGDYAVVRDVRVGYLVVHVAPTTAAKAKGAEQDPCALPHETPERTKCTSEKVPGAPS